MPGGAPMIAPETGRRRTLRPRLARAGSAPRQPRPAFRRPKPPAAPRRLADERLTADAAPLSNASGSAPRGRDGSRLGRRSSLVKDFFQARANLSPMG